MISKWKINLIAFLLSMTLFSVGFSSWQITSKFIEETTGTITVDSVLAPPESVAKLITIDSVECFSYNSTDIVHVNPDGTFKEANKTATVTAYFTLRPNALNTYFGNLDVSKLSIDATLTYSGTTEALFGGNCNDYKGAATLNGSTTNYTAVSSSTTNVKFTAILNDVLSSSESELSLVMRFTFTIPTEKYTTFYNGISNTNFAFNVSASLSAYTESAI